MDLPPRRHVWIPEKCEYGLVYEHKLHMCVLPADDWECVLDADVPSQTRDYEPNQNEISQTDNEDLKTTTKAGVLLLNDPHMDERDPSTKNDDDYDRNVQVMADEPLSSEEEEVDDEEEEEDDDDDNLHLNDGSGDGLEYVELEGLLPAENREGEGVLLSKEQESEPSKTTTSNIDPQLTQHLQRLSQLIDGLKQTYQTKDEDQTNLRPDQLNAFLTHFNIKNNFDALAEANYKASPISSTTPPPPPPPTQTPKVDLQVSAPIYNRNETIQLNLGNKLRPETKLLLSNYVPKYYSDAGYSSSQIVVNRPEGSVLFGVPEYGNSGSHHYTDYHGTPKISEDTLKTVLELSKQMIATQNVPKVIPNPAYYPQHIIQPFIMPAQAFPGQFAAYYNPNNQMAGFGNSYGFLNPTGSYKKPRPGNYYGSKKPSATIIHNNVHVTSPNSGEKTGVIDSYGQYPPLSAEDTGNNAYQPQTVSHVHQHTIDNNKIVTVTTVRPIVTSLTSALPHEFQPTPATIASFYTPSPHLNENNANSIFHATERYPTIPYGNLPTPMHLKRPTPTQSPYQTFVERPTQSSSAYQTALFPMQIDPNKIKIRPNSQKYESVENETDENSEYAPQSQMLTYDTFSSDNNQHNHAYFTQPSTTKRPMLNAFSSSFSNANGNFLNNPSNYDGMHLVNFGGNYMPYDTFRKSILPFVGQSQLSGDLGQVEVITCSTGVRQPNTTDCTRYYVCSKKDGKVLSYTCPPFTAFNGLTHICDASTYTTCNRNAQLNSYTANTNRLQTEALLALQEAQRRRDQALQAQTISNMLQQQYNSGGGGETQTQENEEPDSNDAYMQESVFSGPSSTTSRPSTMSPKKRKYFCKEGDKVADQTSIYNYFVCYKNAQGRMKGHKMTCPNGLLFCSTTNMCTLETRCNN